MATGASAIFFRTPSSSSSSLLLLLFTSGQPFYESPARGAEHGGSLHRRPRRPRRRRRSLASSPSAATATHLAQTTISGPEERTDHRPTAEATATASCRPSKKTFFFPPPLPPPFLFGETAALVRSFFRSSDVCSSPSPSSPGPTDPTPVFLPVGHSSSPSLPPSLPPPFPSPFAPKKRRRVGVGRSWRKRSTQLVRRDWPITGKGGKSFPFLVLESREGGGSVKKKTTLSILTKFGEFRTS